MVECWRLRSPDELLDAFYRKNGAQSRKALLAIQATVVDAAKNYLVGGMVQIPMMALVVLAVKTYQLFT
jgi:hypothetical protein